MRILAIDTSSKVLGVAVIDEKGRRAEFNDNYGLRHTSHLIPTMKKALGSAGLRLKDIDAYAVNIGPGSFTGLRIGVSTVKALWLVNKRKVVAVPSLDVLAYNIPYTEDTICVVVDAKKEKVYARFYEYKSSAPSPQRGEGRGEGDNVGNFPLTPSTPLRAGLILSPKGRGNAVLIGYEELFKRIAKIKNGILLVGDGIEKLSAISYQLSAKKKKKIKFTDRKFWYPRAINVAKIGLQMLKKGDVVKDVDSLVPVYLHPRDVQCRK